MKTYSIKAVYVNQEDATITRTVYSDGSLALVSTSIDDDGFPNVEKLSVNLQAYGMTPPEGHVYVKAYSEHEGLAEALAEAGVATIVEIVHFGPHSTTAVLMKINEEIK